MSNTVLLGLDGSVFDKLLSSLDKIDKKLRSIEKSIKSLGITAGKIKFEFVGTQAFNDLLVTISRAKVNQVTSLISALKELSTLNFSVRTLNGLLGISDVLQKFTAFTRGSFSGFNSVMDTLVSASSANLGDFSALTKLTSKLKLFFDSLGKIDTTANQKFADVFAGITKLATLGSNTELEDFSKVASRLGAGLKKIFDTFSQLEKGSGQNLAKFIAGFTAILQLLSFAVSKLPGGSQVREVSLTMERLGIGISGLFREVEKINFKNSRNVIAFIISTIGLISLFSRAAGNTEKVKALAAVFSGIGLAVSALFKAIDVKRIDKTKEVNKIIKSRIDFVLDIIKQTRKVKAGNLTALGDAFSGLAKIMNAATDIEKAGGLSEGTISNIKSLMSSLNVLNKLKINSNVGNALRGLGDIFAAGGQDVLGKSFGFGTDLSDSIAKGFVKGAIDLAIKKVLLKAFLELNPITLTYRFVTGFIQQFRFLDQTVTRIFEGLVNKINSAGDSLINIGQRIVQNFGVGNLLQSQAFQSAVSFDKLTDQVRIFGNLSEEETKKIRDLSFQLGKDFPLSANDAIQASLDLIKTGLGVEDIYNALPTAAQLASAGNVGVAESAELLIKSVSNFENFSDTVAGGYENVSTAADIFVGIADLTIAEIPDLAAAIAKVGPVANTVGINLEETAAIMGIFANSGLEGANAGTQLRSILRNLTRPVPAVQKRLRELGITLTDTEGSFLSANEIFNQFVTQFDKLGLTEQQQFEQLSVIFGGEGVAGAAALIGSGADAIKNLQTQLHTLPTTAERATQQLDNFQGEVIQLQGSVDTLQTKAFLPLLEDIFRPIVKVLRFVIDSFIELDDTVLKLISTGIALSSIFATLLGSGLIFTGLTAKIGGGVINIAAQFLSFSKILNLVATGFSLLIGFVTGFVAVLGAFVVFAPLVLAISAAFQGFLEIFRGDLGGARTALDSVRQSVSTLFDAFRNLFSSILDILPQIDGGGILASVGSGIGSFLKTISSGLNQITLFVDGFRQMIDASKAFLGIGTRLTRTITENPVLNAIFGSETAKKSGLSAAIPGINNLVRDITGSSRQFVNFSDTVGNSVQSATNSLDRWKISLSGVAEETRDFTGDYAVFAETVKNNPVIDFIMQRTGLSFDRVTNFVFFFRQLVSDVYADFTQLGRLFGTFFKDIGEKGLGTAFRNLRDNISPLVKDFVSTLFSDLRLLGLDFGAFTDKLIEGDFAGALQTGIQGILNKLKNFFLNNIGTIENVVFFLFDKILTPGKILRTIANALGIQPIVEIFDTFERVLRGLIHGIFGTIQGLLQGQSLGDALLGGFGEGIQPVIKFINALSKAVGVIIDIFKGLFSFLIPSAGQNIEDPIITTITNIFDFMTNFLDTITNLVLLPIKNILKTIDLSSVLDFITELFSGISSFFGSISIGDLGGAVSSLGKIGTAFVDMVRSLITQFFGIDLASDLNLIDIIATTVFTLLQRGFDVLKSFISSIDFIGIANTLISFITNALNNIDFIGTFLPIAVSIISGLGDAIVSVFSSVGDFLGLDTTDFENTVRTAIQGAIDNLKTFFLGDEDTQGIFSSITTIFDKLGQAIQGVINLFTGGDTANLVNFNSAAQGLLDFFGRLIALSIETLTDPLSGIAEFFSKLSELDPLQLLVVVSALAGIGLALTQFLAPGLLAGFSGFVGQIASLAGQAIGIAVVGVTVSNFAENLGILADAAKSLVDLDLSGALGKFTEFVGKGLVGTGFDILGLFGISEVFGQSEQDILNTVELIGNSVQTILNDVGSRLSDFFTNTVVPAIERIRSTVDSLISVFRTIFGIGATLVFSPIIVVIKAIQAFVDLPQENKDRLITFVTLLGAAILGYRGITAIASGLNLFFYALQNGTGIVGAFKFVLSGLSSVSFGFLSPALGVATRAVGALSGAFQFLFTKILPIILIATFLASVVQNIDKLFSAIYNLLSLDIAGFVSEFTDFFLGTFVDFVFNLAGLFGIDEIFGQSVDDFKLTIDRLVFTIDFSLNQLGNSIRFFFEDIFRDLAMRFNIAAADIRLTIADLNARLSTIGGGAGENPFFNVASFFDPQFGGANILSIANALLDPTQNIDRNVMNDFAIKYQQELVKSFADNASVLGTLIPPETLISALNLLKTSGALDDALISIFNLPPDAQAKAIESLSRVFTDPAAIEQLGQDGVSALADSIRRAVDRGDLSAEEGLRILDLINISADSTLDDTDIENAKTFLRDYITHIQQLATDASAINGGQPVDVPITVNPVVAGTTPTDDFLNNTRRTVKTAIETGATPPVEVPVTVSGRPTSTVTSDLDEAIKNIEDAAAGSETTIEVPVSPLIDSLTTASDVVNLATDMTELNDIITSTDANFSIFAQRVNENIANVQLLSDTTSSAGQTIESSINMVVNAFMRFAITTTLFVPAYMATLALLVLQTNIAANSMDAAIRKIEEAFNRVAIRIGSILTGIAELQNVGPVSVNVSSSTGTSGSGRNAPGRASGGPVGKGLYEVVEGGIPEILQMGGRTYLMSPGSGFVVPPSPSNKFGVGATVPSVGKTPASMSSNIVVQEGDIILNITSSPGTDTTLLTKQVQTVVRDELDKSRSKVREVLRTAGRS